MDGGHMICDLVQTPIVQFVPKWVVDLRVRVLTVSSPVLDALLTLYCFSFCVPLRLNNRQAIKLHVSLKAIDLTCIEAHYIPLQIKMFLESQNIWRREIASYAGARSRGRNMCVVVEHTILLRWVDLWVTVAWTSRSRLRRPDGLSRPTS